MTDSLRTGRVELIGMLPGASNYTLLAKLFPGGRENDAAEPGPNAVEQDGATLVVYKPRRGETPLWDFPPGTLCRREVAAYVLATEGGWDFIPPTVLRQGPFGLGAVQVWVEHDPAITAFNLLSSHREDLKRIALFDLIANNADRKAGHILLDPEGKLWGVDHGLCFHGEPKLRTVLWDFIGEPIPPADLQLALRLCRFLDTDQHRDGLADLLTSAEIQALRRRVREILDKPVFPPPQTSRPYPWPPI